MNPDYEIKTLEQLQALSGEIAEASRRKEVSYIHPVYKAWIEASPFAILATVGPAGLDTSPRGDPAGFVQVLDEKTLLLPERRGNNRMDSLRNLISDPRLSLIFLIPGIGETLRVNGRGSITVDPEILARFEIEGKRPKCVIRVEVDTVFFQCARAIHRSKLWQALLQEHLDRVPSAGTILDALTNSEIEGENYDLELPSRLKSTLY